MAEGTVYVKNLKEVRRAFRQYAPDLLPVLRTNVKGAIDQSTVPKIKSRVPERSGAAAGSIRATAGGNTFYVVAGNAKVPYFGWLDFGGTLRPTGKRYNTQVRPRVPRGRYVYPGADESQPQLLNAVVRALDATTAKFNAGRS